MFSSPPQVSPVAFALATTQSDNHTTQLHCVGLSGCAVAMALRARLSACVSSVIRVATPAVARSACVRAQPAVCAAPIDLTARWLNTSTQEAVDGEPVDWTTLIPDNLQLHNPQDALPEAKRQYTRLSAAPRHEFTECGFCVFVNVPCVAVPCVGFVDSAVRDRRCEDTPSAELHTAR